MCIKLLSDWSAGESCISVAESQQDLTLGLALWSAGPFLAYGPVRASESITIVALLDHQEFPMHY